MTWGFLPPAVSEVHLMAVVARLLRRDATQLEDEICTFLGARRAAAGSSWVHVLRLLLEELAARDPDRREVLLPSYSCNEFTKATLLAGLEPTYVDLQRDLRSDPSAIAAAINSRTLAAFSINNIGRESDNASVREVCDRRGIVCIEDATYMFLGTSARDGQRFGTYGHYAVLNFSEGKIIPVGGGAVLTNVRDGIDVIDAVRRRIAQRSPRSTAAELMRLAIYRAGSSRLGYSAYRVLRELTGADLKQRLSMEPTRTKEVGNDLERDTAGNIVLRTERSDSLDDRSALRALGRPKQLCGSEVVRRAERERNRRLVRYDLFRRELANVPGVEVLSLPDNGMPIKAPVLINGDITPEDQRELDRLGVARGYSTEYPTYGDDSYPNANRFFERLFTLPVHRYVDGRVVRDIIAVLARATRGTVVSSDSPRSQLSRTSAHR